MSKQDQQVLAQGLLTQLRAMGACDVAAAELIVYVVKRASEVN